MGCTTCKTEKKGNSLTNSDNKRVMIYDYITLLEDYELNYELIQDNSVGINEDNLDELICPICLNILRDPKCCSSNDNSHSFCKICIEKYMEKSKNCPSCRQNFEYKNNDKINKLLYKLNFKCIYNDKGCKEIISYLNYQNHLQNCQYRECFYECQVDKYYYSFNNFRKCNYKGNMKTMIDHFDNCEFSYVNCMFCSKIITRIKAKEHYQKECNVEIVIEKNGYNHFKKKDGSYGKYNYLNGDIFIGCLNGYGRFFYSNGNRYEGEMVNGYVDGYGRLYSVNGNIYEGEFKYDMNGYGTCLYLNGEKYEGKWKYGQKDGIGMLYKKNNELYLGEFHKDKMEGYGIYKYSNGEKYEGQWKNNVKEGYGVFYQLKGKKIIGKWKN